jgi:type VI secretion system protein ImpG
VRQSEQLYQGFLEEMQALEHFRLTYSSVNPEAMLERDDPEVRRLIEAMAFFTAQTRTSALRNILATRRRMFQQFFSFMLSPLAATGLLQAKPSGRFAEPTVLPRGTEVLVAAENEQPAIFRTLAELRILPLRLDAVDTLLLPKEGFRLVLQFAAAFPRNDEIGTLPVLVNHLNNYGASLQVFSNLRKHLRRAIVVFDERVTEISDGAAVEVHFGPLVESDAAPHPPHPIQEVRSHFQAPERELYMRLALPSPPRNWRRFAVCLDVSGGWPKELRLNRDVFQLFTVPIANLRQGMAQPILCDGMQEHYPIRHPEPALRFSLHSVLGVYQIEKKGLVAVRPGIIAGGRGSYEVERLEGEDGSEVSTLRLEFPEAFAEPKKIAVDALWLQPWFSKLATTSKLTASLYSRVIAGVDLELVGEMRPHRENPLQNDVDGLLQVLALKNRATLRLEDIMTILRALGSVETSHWKQVPGWITDLSVTSVPQARELGGLKHIYALRLREFDPTYRPMVEVFLRQLQKLLNAWISDGVVAIEATAGQSVERITID